MKLEEIRETLEELKARIAEVEAQLAELQGVTDTCREEGAESLAGEGLKEIQQDLPGAANEDIPGESQEGMRMEPQEDIPEDITVAEDIAEAAPIDISIDDLDIEPVRFEPEPVVVENAKPIEAKSLEEAIMESTREQDAPATLLGEELKTEGIKETAEVVTKFENRKAPETGKVISINDKEEKRARKAVVDIMGEKFPWRTAIQASPVKNVISAISLNDRVLFINTLFNEDPLAFQEAIAAFNSMTSLEEAEKYVFEKFPEWNFSSDTVFKLMMAVRRKLD